MSHRFARGTLAFAASFALVATLAPLAVAEPHDQGSDDTSPLSAAQRAFAKQFDQAPAPDSQVRVVVLLKDQPSTPSTASESSNLAEQNELIETWAKEFDLTVDRQLGYLINGFSATMPANKMAALALQPEVASVREELLYEPAQHSASELGGAATALEQHGVDGTGTVISIIDTGVDPRHPDLRLDDCSAAKIKEINPQPDGAFTCKVPNGYNYADENFVVADTEAGQHGQHVAGSAAANGSSGPTSEFDTTGRIDGTAPNAQLLAMKVFSNDPARSEGAQTSDIIAAIEDSVKLGADVINMSLGSPNGIPDASDGVYAALKAAREQGVLSVISAGNEGLNFSLSGATDDLLGRFDDGPVGSSSITPYALSVASVDNAKLTFRLGYLADRSFGYSLASGSADGQEHAVRHVGLGRAEDYPQGTDLKGYFALIQRGEITFAEKFQRAFEHGADGVVVYNHATGGDSAPGMGGLGAFTQFGAAIGHSDGLAIVQALEANPDATIRFTQDVGTAADPNGLRPSFFTSWGPTPSLDFKPEIAGIGGNVYSTVYADKYQSMSGTSMAAPNVSGLSALLLEELKERYPQLSAAERVDLLKTTLMNTAQILTNADGVPYAPRQIGAGLARVDRALNTQVTATVDGSAAVALREVTEPRSFTVTLTNRGQTDASYSIGAQRVLSETNEAGKPTTVQISGETLAASASEVTVPAGGTAQVTFTLVPNTSGPHFIEGWAQFSGTGGVPDLAVPYLGFVGDWGAEQIVQPRGQQWAKGLTGPTTGLVSTAGRNTVNMYTEQGDFALSPNEDLMLDSLAPSLLLMRNADQLRFEVADSSGKVIVEQGPMDNVRRTTGNRVLTAIREGTLTKLGFNFNGKVWDQAKGEWGTIPDGDYRYRVKARVNETEDWQVTELPFTVDTVAPEVDIVEHSATEIRFTVSDDRSGVLDKPFVFGPGEEQYEVSQQDDGSWRATFPEGLPFVSVEALDQGLNTGQRVHTFAPATLSIGVEGRHISGDQAWLSQHHVAEPVMFAGAVSPEITRVTVNDEEAELDGAFYRYELASFAGDPVTVTVRGFNADGHQVTERTITVQRDLKDPVFEITSGIDDAGKLVVDDDGAGKITGRISDDRSDADLGLSFDATPVKLAEDGSFSHSFTLDAADTEASIVVSDGANVVAKQLGVAGRNSTPTKPSTALEITSPSCSLGACYLNSRSSQLSDDGTRVRVTGTVDDQIRSVSFTPGSRAGDDGLTPGEPIEATISEGTFSVELPITGLANVFRLLVRDDSGKVVLDQPYHFLVDITPPSLDFTEPELVGGTLYTNTAEVTFSGSIADDGWGHRLLLNNKMVTNFVRDNNPGPDVNRQEFTERISVSDGDQILIESKDDHNNFLAGVIPVVVDQKAPSTGLDAAYSGQVIRDSRDLLAWVEDDNLASLKVTLNGETVAEEATPLSTQRLEVEDVVTPPQPDEADAGSPAPDPADAGAHSEPDSATDQADQQPAEASHAPVQVVSGAETRTTVTRLEASIATADLPAGQHTVVVEGTDLAGNQTQTTVVFYVDAAAVINGPDPLELKVAPGALADQDAVAKLLLANYSLTDDGSAFAPGETTLGLLPGTVLVPGKQQVTLVATDPDGRLVLRSVSVTITVHAEPPAPGDDNGNGSGGSSPGGTGSGGAHQGGTPGSSGKVPGQPNATTDAPLGKVGLLVKGGNTPAKLTQSGKTRPWLPSTGGEGEPMNLIGIAALLALATASGLVLRHRRAAKSAK